MTIKANFEFPVRGYIAEKYGENEILIPKEIPVSGVVIEETRFPYHLRYQREDTLEQLQSQDVFFDRADCVAFCQTMNGQL